MRLIFDKSRYPDGVSIRGKSVKIDFAHVQAFRPAQSSNTHTWTNDLGKHLQYWDHTATISIWNNPSPPEPTAKKAQAKNDEDEAADFLASIEQDVDSGPAAQPSNGVETEQKLQAQTLAATAPSVTAPAPSTYVCRIIPV